MSRLYLVVRRAWSDDGTGLEGEFSPPGGTVVAAFATSAEAEACRDRLEVEARKEVSSPFLLTRNLGDLLHGEDKFARKVVKLGLPEPEVKPTAFYPLGRDWISWYESLDPRPTPEQQERLWALFGDLRFYYVAEVELDDSEEQA
jgi:hypothetical protein